MPPPLHALAALARVADAAIERRAAIDGETASCHFFLFDLLRREQALAASREQTRGEVARILDFAQAWYCELAAVLAGRDDALLDTARDGDWSLRDIVRHAIAVELRYAAQVTYSATRADSEPIAIPESRLPCDRLAPPAAFDESRTAGLVRGLELLGVARDQTHAAIRLVRDDVLDRPSLWGTYRMNVRMRLHQVGAHLAETTVQVEKVLHGEAETESRRILRRAALARGQHERWTTQSERDGLDARYGALADAMRA